jgi:ankyrin repeat protein
MDEQLLEAGSDPSYRNHMQATAIFFAVSGGSESIVRLLCLQGSDLSIKLPDGSSVLRLAAANISATVVSTLSIKSRLMRLLCIRQLIKGTLVLWFCC